MYKDLSKEALLQLLQERDETLQQQNYHYESALADSNLGIVSFVPIYQDEELRDFKIIFYNQIFCSIIGQETCVNLLASQLNPLFPEDWMSILSKALNGGYSLPQEVFSISRKVAYSSTFSIHHHQVSINFKALNEEGINKKRHLEKERYRTISAVTTDYMYEVKMNEDNTPGGLEWIEGAFEKVTGYTPAEVQAVQDAWVQIIHPKDRMRVTDQVAEDIDERRSSRYAYRIRTKSGETRWLEDSVQIRERNGNLRILGAVRNITEEKKIELDLAQERERYRTLFDTSRRGILIVDMHNKRAVDFNPRVLELFQADPDKIKEGNTLQFSPEFQPNGKRSDEELGALFAQHIREHKDIHFEWTFVRPDGEFFIADVAFSPVVLDKMPLSVMFIDDITEKKRAEEALIEAKEAALDNARLKSAFISSMSHEIRTPMNGIIGFTEMLVDPTIPKEEKEQFPFIINDNCQRLLNVLNDILDISKIEAGEVPLRVDDINVNSLLQELYQLFELKAKQKGVVLRLERKLQEGEQFIRTDETKLRQVLNNLLSNAIKFTDKGHVAFGVSQKADRLIFLVEDTGIGISKDQQEKIFDRFQQAQEVSPSNYGGTGLGLSISEGLTNTLGGNIIVSSELAVGTKFCLNIPYNPTTTTNANVRPIAYEQFDFQGQTILVAEDERFNFTLLNKALSLANVKVLHAENGLEAIRLLEQHPEIKLILMDMRMPEMDGMEATRIIKSRSELQHIPIIAQTAFGLNEDQERILEAGCNAYISKPINRRNLYQLLSQFLLTSITQ